MRDFLAPGSGRGDIYVLAVCFGHISIGPPVIGVVVRQAY
jgi:hypothetical protein